MKAKLANGTVINNGVFDFKNCSLKNFRFTMTSKESKQLEEAYAKSFIPEVSILQKLKRRLVGDKK